MGDGRSAKQQHAKSARHVPYARTARAARAHSFADAVAGLCDRLSRPLFGRSSARGGLAAAAADDAFSVPWHVVDRETAMLREELRSAQSAAEEAPPSDGGEPVAAASSSEPPAAAASSEPPAAASPYESVFDTARAIAESRAIAEAASKDGKAADAAPDDSKPADAAPNDSKPADAAAAAAAAAAASDTDDDDDDEDYVPNITEDDAEEDILEAEIEPIDESEEVMTLPPQQTTASGASLSVSQIAELFERRNAPVAEQSADISVEDEPSSSSSSNGNSGNGSDDDNAKEDECAEEEAIMPDEIDEPQEDSDHPASLPEEGGDDEVELEVSEAEDSAGDEAEDGGGGGDSAQQAEVDVVVEEIGSDGSEEGACEEPASIAPGDSASDNAEPELEQDSDQELAVEVESDEEGEATQPLPESPA
ncbi:hypothetical protein H4R18_005692, partial [Coemansia javaensis]